MSYVINIRLFRFLIFFYDGVELDELTLMVLAVIDQLGKLLADGLDIVETRERHVAIQIGSGGTWVKCTSLSTTSPFRILKEFR